MLARDLLEGGGDGGALLLCLRAVLRPRCAEEWPREPAKIVLGMVLMLGLAHGAACLLAAGSVYTEVFDRVTHLFTYLSLPMTGAFFMVFWLPTELQARGALDADRPLFELVRDGQYGTRVPTHYDLPYCAGLDRRRSTSSAWRRCGGRAATSPSVGAAAMIALHGVRKSYHTRTASGRCCAASTARSAAGRAGGHPRPQRRRQDHAAAPDRRGGAPTAAGSSGGMSVSWPLGFAGAMHYSISGADNARFIARIYGKPPGATSSIVEDFAELGEYFRMPVRTYSSGMMMRLGFALSLAVRFRLLPGGRGDGGGRQPASASAAGRARERRERAARCCSYRTRRRRCGPSARPQRSSRRAG